MNLMGIKLIERIRQLCALANENSSTKYLTHFAIDIFLTLFYWKFYLYMTHAIRLFLGNCSIVIRLFARKCVLLHGVII